METQHIPHYFIGNPTNRLGIHDIATCLLNIEAESTMAYAVTINAPYLIFNYGVPISQPLPEPEPPKVMPELRLRKLVFNITDYYIEEPGPTNGPTDGAFLTLVKWLAQNTCTRTFRLCVLNLGNNDPTFHTPPSLLYNFINCLVQSISLRREEKDRRVKTNPVTEGKRDSLRGKRCHIVLDGRPWCDSWTDPRVIALTVSVHNLARSEFGEVTKNILFPKCIREAYFMIHDDDPNPLIFEEGKDNDLTRLTDCVVKRPTDYTGIKDLAMFIPKSIYTPMVSTGIKQIRRCLQDVRAPLLQIYHSDDGFVSKRPNRTADTRSPRRRSRQ
ncbi:hypothetical protein QCA50_015353 [Cerrena zonata]|uniref:Uncharacterized protein n=1 Tax=Cerrena zonata TaxID=2478898 RepID=A0AAW0FRR9_9APHY